jgi:hypothetical protein
MKPIFAVRVGTIYHTGPQERMGTDLETQKDVKEITENEFNKKIESPRKIEEKKEEHSVTLPPSIEKRKIFRKKDGTSGGKRSGDIEEERKFIN